MVNLLVNHRPSEGPDDRNELGAICFGIATGVVPDQDPRSISACCDIAWCPKVIHEFFLGGYIFLDSKFIELTQIGTLMGRVSGTADHEEDYREGKGPFHRSPGD